MSPAITTAGILWAGRWLFPATVLTNAALQGLFVWADPIPGNSVSFVLVALTSLLSVVISLQLIGLGAARAAAGEPVLPRSSRAGVVGLGWTCALVVLAMAAAVLNPFATPVVLLVGAFVLPAAFSHRGLRAAARAPLRLLAAVLVFVVLVAVSWVLAFALGFFVAGPWAALLIWIWFGLVTTVVLAQWTAWMAARALAPARFPRRSI